MSVCFYKAPNPNDNFISSRIRLERDCVSEDHFMNFEHFKTSVFLFLQLCRCLPIKSCQNSLLLHKRTDNIDECLTVDLASWSLVSRIYDDIRWFPLFAPHCGNLVKKKQMLVLQFLNTTHLHVLLI